MEVLVVGGEGMVAFIETLKDIPSDTSGVVITPVLYKDNCHLVDGINGKPYVSGFFDFYTDGHKTIGGEGEGYILTSKYSREELPPAIGDLVGTIFILADTKINLGSAIAESNLQRKARKQLQFGKTAIEVVEVVEAEEVYPSDRDWKASTQVG